MNDDEKVVTPMMAIRAKCLECSCGNPVEVRECLIDKCALYPFRFGKRPAVPPTVKKKERTAAQSAADRAAAVRLRELRSVTGESQGTENFNSL